MPAIPGSRSASRVRLFHWRASEAKPLIEFLNKNGYDVEYLGDRANGHFRSLRENPPLACVIDLTRMPSHGRYAGAALRSQKGTRHIPIVFVDGEPEKIEKIRGELPDAIYTTRAKLPAALKRAKPLADPVKPVPMMLSYGDRTAAQKLGFRENTRAAVIDPPAGYAKVIGALPSGASLEEEPAEALPITIWFVHDPQEYLARLPRMRDVAGRSRLWILYRKASAVKGAGGVNQTLIRQSALDVGMVDYKICSVNETWSGMLFTRKK